jgi:hypothetical protein
MTEIPQLIERLGGGLDDRKIVVRFLSGVRVSLFHLIYIICGANPSFSEGTRGCFVTEDSGRGVNLHSFSYSSEGKDE